MRTKQQGTDQFQCIIIPALGVMLQKKTFSIFFMQRDETLLNANQVLWILHTAHCHRVLVMYTKFHLIIAIALGVMLWTKQLQFFLYKRVLLCEMAIKSYGSCTLQSAFGY